MIDHACYPINGWEHHVEMNIVTRVGINIKCMVRSVDNMFLVTDSLTVETFGQTNCMCDLQKARLDFQVSGTLGDRQSALQDARDLMYISLVDRYIKHTILRQRGKLTDAINLKFLHFSLFRQLPFYSAAIWAMSYQTAKEKFSYQSSTENFRSNLLPWVDDEIFEALRRWC